MQLHCLKTLWGYQNSAAQAALDAVVEGYTGVEGPLPKNIAERHQFIEALTLKQLHYIAEIATTGTYIPDRKQSVQQHLDYLESHLEALAEVKPLFVTCLGGCDAWPLTQSIDFFQQAILLANEYGHEISFETHRGRSLFTPWATQSIVSAIPHIKLTFDISHWFVVCEGLQETEEKLITQLAKNAHHIHARIGYDQGPQVADPLGIGYQRFYQQHFKLWHCMWQSQALRGCQFITMTPEFGPDGYEYRDKNGLHPLVDVAEINRLMCGQLQQAFQQFDGSPQQH